MILGKIQPQYFPAVFGKDANLPLDKEIVVTKFTQLAATIATATDNYRTPEQVASGFIAIAVNNMANAIKKISLQRGYDVTRYVLCCFGGAGAQVACLIADVLGITKIFIHPYAGVLSAYGIGLADIRVTKVESVEMALTSDVIPKLESLMESLESKATKEREEETRELVVKKVNLKYEGTDFTLTINFNSDIAIMKQNFEAEHQIRYGFIQPEKDLVIESALVELIQKMDTPEEPIINRTRPINEPPQSIATVQMFALDKWHDAKVYHREDLQPKDCIKGAAIIVEKINTIIIEPNWQVRTNEHNYLILEKNTL
mgnify:FL=1